jgi:hypothetical protein
VSLNILHALKHKTFYSIDIHSAVDNSTFVQAMEVESALDKLMDVFDDNLQTTEISINVHNMARSDENVPNDDDDDENLTTTTTSLTTPSAISTSMPTIDENATTTISTTSAVIPSKCQRISNSCKILCSNIDSSELSEAINEIDLSVSNFHSS